MGKTTKRKSKAATELSSEELAHYGCSDCGVNVVTIGEFYMLNPDIWGGQLQLGWDDNLCIGCLERRLGRKVSLYDMCSFPNEPWMKPLSIRLLHRLVGHQITKRPPYRLRKGAYIRGITSAMAKAIGEYGASETGT
jgi:hypothetical protein